MTPTTLQALRRLLFFSVPEAASLIPVSAERPQGVTERSWRFWEDGRRPVPQDVAERLQALLAWRAQALAAANDHIGKARAARHADTEFAPPTVVWYETLGDWLSLRGRDAVLWRPQCSVVGALCAEHGMVAVPFDASAYSTWRGRSADSETRRAEWAARQTMPASRLS